MEWGFRDGLFEGPDSESVCRAQTRPCHLHGLSKLERGVPFLCALMLSLSQQGRPSQSLRRVSGDPVGALAHGT